MSSVMDTRRGIVIGGRDIMTLVRFVQNIVMEHPFLAKKEHSPRKGSLRGHCYVASEALFHLLGAKGAGWKPVNVKVEGVSHWYLRHESGLIIDATAGQFIGKTVPYEHGVGRGFLTRVPSKRAQFVIQECHDMEMCPCPRKGHQPWTHCTAVLKTAGEVNR